ncbi:spore germination protein [Cohnella sp. GCM10027633]|uniref:spore germination protein n=1 Tax=unclassified Cohnella TaxID=2636738 RepID=UPI00362E478D
MAEAQAEYAGLDGQTLASRLTGDAERDMDIVRTAFSGCEDVVVHDAFAAGERKLYAVYVRGMVNAELLDKQALEPLQRADAGSFGTIGSVREALAISDCREIRTFADVVRDVMDACPVVFVDGIEGALTLGLTHYPVRSVEEPQAESVVRGSRDGFIESLAVNMTLLRRRVRSPAMKFRSFTVGRLSKTPVRLAYIQGIAKPEVVAEVADKLARIDVDNVPESGTLEEWLEGTNYSPFPQLQMTERPDVAVAALMEGRVVVLAENTPVALIAPTTFWSLMQSSEDYNERFLIGTFIRWLRYMFFAMALLAPSVYVAVLTFHHEMVPTTLLLRVARSREEIPFPAWMEALIMEITFEALREAGVRLPKQIGSAVSIVGALVIGQAAIQAGIVSAPMVMIVAITGISSFMLPQYSISVTLRLLRFPIMLLSGLVGLYGLVICILAIVSHLCCLKSFGVPYLSPLAPIDPSGLKDTIIRAPLKRMKRRPSFFAKGDLIRNGGSSEDRA